MSEGLVIALVGLGGVVIGGALAFWGAYYAANRSAESARLLDRKQKLEQVITSMAEARACSLNDSYSRAVHGTPAACNLFEPLFKAQAISDVYFPILVGPVSEVKTYALRNWADRLAACRPQGDAAGCISARSLQMETSGGYMSLVRAMEKELARLE